MKNVKLFCLMLVNIKDVKKVNVSNGIDQKDNIREGCCFIANARSSNLVTYDLGVSIQFANYHCEGLDKPSFLEFFSLDKTSAHEFLYLKNIPRRDSDITTGLDYYNKGKKLLAKYKCLSHLSRVENNVAKIEERERDFISLNFILRHYDHLCDKYNLYA